MPSCRRFTVETLPLKQNLVIEGTDDSCFEVDFDYQYTYFGCLNGGNPMLKNTVFTL